eukprot:scaffold15877_cov31-Attheya_sp.AAC.1
MEAQGYGVDENVVGQDNMSTMLLENNGRASSSRPTRHINVRYFFVTYRIKNKEMSIIHCPTGEMVAEDYFTKPLQGALFKKFRDLIMNVDDVDPLTDSHKDQRSVLGIKGNPTQDSDGNVDSVKDESVVEPRIVDGSIVAGKPKMSTITGKLKMAMDIGKNDDSGQNTNMDEKNMHVHTKKGAMLRDRTTYASILHGLTRNANVAEKLPEKRENDRKHTFDRGGGSDSLAEESEAFPVWFVEENDDASSSRRPQRLFADELLASKNEGGHIMDNCLFSTGVGIHQMVAAQLITWTQPRQMLSSGSLGTMGVALGYAIGTKLANGSYVVIDIDGDGSFNMTFTELKTVTEQGIPVKIMILDNES